MTLDLEDFVREAALLLFAQFPADSALNMRGGKKPTVNIAAGGICLSLRRLHFKNEPPHFAAAGNHQPTVLNELLKQICSRFEF